MEAGGCDEAKLLARIRALEVAHEALEKLMDAKLEAAALAVQKAEGVADARFDSHNKFREENLHDREKYATVVALGALMDSLSGTTRWLVGLGVTVGLVFMGTLIAHMVSSDLALKEHATSSGHSVSLERIASIGARVETIEQRLDAAKK